MASTVIQTIEDIKSFRPMDIKFIQRCINDFLDEKYHNGIPNHMNYGAHIERCPKCGSVHFVKNGFDHNHKQKYRCKDCNAVFSATTGTMFSNSPVSYDIWRIFITGELNELTLQQQSAATRLSVNDHFQKDSLMISDSKQAIINFALENGMRSDSIPTSPTKTYFTTPLGNNLGSVNELHTEAKNMLRQKHGVGTRLLQGYLDWILFRKQMKYRYEADLWADKAYEQAMREQVPFTCDEIRDKTMPIDLYQAYGSYHYGIYGLSTKA